MKPSSEASTLLRLMQAVGQHGVGSLLRARPSEAAQFAKGWLRFPIEYSAIKAVDDTPEVTFSELFPDFVVPHAMPPIGPLERHGWNVRLDEKIYISFIVQAMQAKRIFEIGTFDGGTTLCMAQSSPPDAQIFTLDLPPQEFDRTQTADNFSGSQVGAKFQNTQAQRKITQLLGDSTQFDYSPYLHSMDIVFVDAAHDYPHGLSDSKNALRLVKPGGLILWHDYQPYWHGLVRAIQTATRNYKLQRLAGTSIAVLQTKAK